MAEGTYNLTSLEPPQEEAPLRQIHDVDDLDNIEVHEVLDEDDSITEIQEEASEVVAVERNGQRGSLSRDEENEVVAVERSRQRRTTTTTSSKKHEKKEKRPKKGERIEEMMGRYLDMRTKQVQDESADLAKEKEVAEGNDFSIKRCISILSTMELTKEEKAKAFAVFIKSKENREAFLSGCELDREATLVWLKSAMV